MKICVFSDSHGYADNMISTIGIEKPDACFFLGDGERDIEKVAGLFPDLPIYKVRGNCDFRSDNKSSMVCVIDGVTIFATHGHMSYVKYEPELDTLTSQALDAGADIALFGHTHRQHLSERFGVTLLNPGTASTRHCSCYAVLTINSGKYQAELKMM